MVSQQLIPRKGSPGRVAALEVLINTAAVANLIRQGKIDQWNSRCRRGRRSACAPWTPRSSSPYDQGLITGLSAYEKAINKAKFEPLRELG